MTAAILSGACAAYVPGYMRLIMGGYPPMVSSSATASAGKAQAYAAGQGEGILDPDLDPAHLVFLIIALNAWWFSAPQLARMLTGSDGEDPAEHARRRASVV